MSKLFESNNVNHKLIKHPIQKHIFEVLKIMEIARFRDLRPAGVDTNVFSYHLGILQKEQFVQKTTDGYMLGYAGISYLQNAQPLIVTMLLVQNSDGDLLLQKTSEQPYINTWALPFERFDTKQDTLNESAQQTIHTHLGLPKQSIRHVGDCYIRAKRDSSTLSIVFAHIIRFETEDIVTNENLVWVRPHKLSDYKLAPATEQIISRSFFGDDFFFEEFEEDWVITS